MAGINQLPGGSEYAAAISLIWATTSWFCSAMLLWLTWSHHEGFSCGCSYLFVVACNIYLYILIFLYIHICDNN